MKQSTNFKHGYTILFIQIGQNMTLSKRCIRHDIPLLIKNSAFSIKNKIITHSLQGCISYHNISWGAVVARNNAGLSVEVVQFHLPPFRNLSNFVHPVICLSFGRDTKSRWSLLSGVYARGSKRSHTGGKCVTCSGLPNSREAQHNYALAQVSAVWRKPPKIYFSKNTK